MPEENLNARDAKLVQWLNEAHAKESELEADLTAHIALTEKATYKKRLRKHLTETRDHKRKVASRIKKLGSAVTPAANLPGVPDAVGEVAGKAVAAVKTQVGAARALVTSQAETHLRNAQEELREEHVEIALYKRIETFATEVGDRETAQLAKAIRRDEERMAKFLDAELTRLVKEVVRSEIPRDQRTKSTRSRRTTTRTTTRGTTARRSTSSRSTGTGSRTRSASSGSSRTRSASSGTARPRSTGTGSRTRAAASGSSRTRSSGAARSSGSTRSSGTTRSSGATRSSGTTRKPASARSSGTTRKPASARASSARTSSAKKTTSSGSTRGRATASSRSASSRNGSSAGGGSRRTTRAVSSRSR